VDEQDFKVVRDLDSIMPAAATPQKAGVSFDIRLYLSENSRDGKLWASVSFLDRDGHLLKHPDNALPLDKPDAVGWYFDHIAKKGFPLAREMKTRDD
jgi:hypothetical protein